MPMQETWAGSLGREDPLEKEMATHSGTLALKTPWTEKLGADYYPWGRKESGTTERLHFHFHLRTEGFSGGSDSKESACNARNPDSIPR